MQYHTTHPHFRELTADDVKLVELDKNHASESLSWVKDLDVVQYMGTDFPDPTVEGELDRIEAIRKNEDEYSWMIEHEGRIIGNVCINSIKETSGKFGKKAGNLTVLIGDKNFWGKGYGAKVCQAVLDWAFNEAKFEAMAARALQENIASIKTLHSLGFRETRTEPYEGLIHGKPSSWRNFKLER